MEKVLRCYILTPIIRSASYHCKVEQYDCGTSWYPREQMLLWKSLFTCGVGFVYKGYSHLLVMNNRRQYRVRRLRCSKTQRKEFARHYTYSDSNTIITYQTRLAPIIISYIKYRYSISLTINDIDFRLHQTK